MNNLNTVTASKELYLSVKHKISRKLFLGRTLYLPIDFRVESYSVFLLQMGNVKQIPSLSLVLSVSLGGALMPKKESSFILQLWKGKESFLNFLSFC